ncbi:hypothetical protein EXS74_03455 [Candidatus Woesearchaeota archaeon]|nr:hypothetical protein [Candidatus Woesearchaeota archaeon]
MVVKKSSSSNNVKKIGLALQDVPIPPVKEGILSTEAKNLKGIPLESVPLPPLFFDENFEEKSPFDFVSPQHGLFKKFNLFHLGFRKVFPIMHETVFVTEESPSSFPERDISFPSVVMEEHPRVKLPPDPWQRTQELLLKCRTAIEKRKVDYAQIYYEELKPFYPRLETYQQTLVSQVILDMQQDLEMLKLSKLKEQLKKVH